jgi:hypothetical protein
MDTKGKRQSLQCEAVARAAFGNPQKPAREQPEPKEAYWRCPRHDDMKGGDPRKASLKVNPEKNTWGCFVCNAGGNPWELVAFAVLKKSIYKWESLTEPDRKEVTAWLREHNLLAESTRSRKAAMKTYPILREFVYRNGAGEPIARRTRHEAPPEEPSERFRWWHWENEKWKPGFQKVNDLPLYIGLPAKPELRDATAYLNRLDALEDSPQIILCEGEHDADAGAQIGLPTVTSGGTSSLLILQRNKDFFSDQDVVILAHPGVEELEFAEKVAATLHGVAERIKIVKLQDALAEAGVKDLADIVEAKYRDMPAENLRDTLEKLFGAAREWHPPGGAEVLDAAYNFLGEWLSAPDSALRILTLWTAFTYVYRHWRHAPLLHIYSPEANCGKTTVLKLLKRLAANAEYSDSPSESSAFRLIDQKRNILLLDEMDTKFRGKEEDDKAMQRMLNSVFERDSKYHRTEQVGKNWEVRSYDVFCPVAFATIRSNIVPSSTRSRAIPIPMQRLRGKPRYRETPEETVRGEAIGARLATWIYSVENDLADADPFVPQFDSARQVDISEPLLAIAEAVGSDWAEASRRALCEQLTGTQTGNESPQGKLLTDMYGIFHPRDDNGEPSVPPDRIGSTNLACALGKMETSPWPNFGGRSACKQCSLHHITPEQIKKLLADFRDAEGRKIEPRDMRIDGRIVKGYERTWFEAAWKAYSGEDSTHMDAASVLPRLGATGEATESKADNPTCCGVAPEGGRHKEKLIGLVKASEWRSERDAPLISIFDPSDPDGGRHTRVGSGKTVRPSGVETAMLDRSGMENTMLDRSGKSAVLPPGSYETRGRRK